MKVIVQSISLTFFLLLLLTSCEKKFDIDNSAVKNKLVLFSEFHPYSSFDIHLSRTISPYENEEQEVISSAIIRVESNSQSFDDFIYTENGNYHHDINPLPGIKYKITVDYKEFKTITAESYIPPTLDVMLFRNSPIVNENNEKVLKTELDINHNEDVFIMICHIVDKKSTSINSDTIFHTDSVWIQSEGTNFESVLPDYATTEFLFAKLKGNDVSRLTFFSFDGFVKDENLVEGTSRFEIYSCSRDYYNYMKSKQLIEWNNKGINSSIINSNSLYNNVKNGLGIFAGYNKVVFYNKFK